MTKKYIEEFEGKYNAKPIPEIFHDSGRFIEEMGNKPFRDFEEFVIVSNLQNKAFNNVALDLGGAAFLREAVQKQLNECGFVTVFIDAPRERVAKNLLKDYLKSKETGIITRGNYYRTALKAEEAGQSAITALDKFSEENRASRNPSYAKANIKVTIDNSDSLQDMFAKVKNAYNVVVYSSKSKPIPLTQSTNNRLNM